MENQHKRIGYPKTAYELFLKIYCKKRGGSSEKNTLLAAVKAWITLSKEEKETFIEKFCECKTKYQNQIASNLKSVEPYMKKKQVKRTQEPTKSMCESVGDNRINVALPFAEERTSVIEENMDEAENRSSTNFQIPEFTLEDQHTNPEINNLEEYEVPVLSEPSPPNVRNSIDLFNMIKNKNGESDLEWTSLSKAEKMRYRKAVYQLKKDYIRNYKTYLESLPSKKIFKYYHTFER